MKIIQLEAAHANIDMIELRQRETERGEREELRGRTTVVITMPGRLSL